MRLGIQMSPLRRELLVLAFVALSLLALAVRQFRAEYLLSNRAQPVEATVISKHSGHGWIEYSYVVAGHTYEGSTPATSTGRSFERVSVGDKLTVQFDPANPGVSGTPETREATTSTVPFFFFAIAMFTGIVFLRNALRKS
jgi:hypothetical protein